MIEVDVETANCLDERGVVAELLPDGADHRARPLLDDQPFRAPELGVDHERHQRHLVGAVAELIDRHGALR